MLLHVDAEDFGFRISVMSGKFSPMEVAHVAMLARLELTDQEAELYAEQLSSVLDHATDIESLDLGDTPPTAHPLGMVNVVRQDLPRSSLTSESVLRCAPDQAENMFSVPPVLGAD